MAKQTAVTITLATLLGVALGGLVLWKAAQRRKGKTCCSSHQEEAAVKSADEKLIKVEDKKVLSFFRSPTFSWVERTLGADIVIVSEQEEWDHVEPLLKKDLEKWPVLGIDCEWVSVEGKANPVSLLQMASFSGLCILVRLPRLVSSGHTLPKTLLDIMADSAVLKVGVGCWEDACKLLQDYGLPVKGSMDLRYLAMRQRKDLLHNCLSLKSLAEKVLNFPLDKSPHVRCSNWEAEELTEDQVCPLLQLTVLGGKVTFLVEKEALQQGDLILFKFCLKMLRVMWPKVNFRLTACISLLFHEDNFLLFSLDSLPLFSFSPERSIRQEPLKKCF